MFYPWGSGIFFYISFFFLFDSYHGCHQTPQPPWGSLIESQPSLSMVAKQALPQKTHKKKGSMILVVYSFSEDLRQLAASKGSISSLPSSRCLLAGLHPKITSIGLQPLDTNMTPDSADLHHGKLNKTCETRWKHCHRLSNPLQEAAWSTLICPTLSDFLKNVKRNLCKLPRNAFGLWVTYLGAAQVWACDDDDFLEACQRALRLFLKAS